jgi:hypothetical protein
MKVIKVTFDSKFLLVSGFAFAVVCMVAKNFGVSWIAGRGTVDYKGRNTGGLCPSHMFKFGCSLEVGLWAKEFVNLIFLNYEMQTKIKSCPVPGFKKKKCSLNTS